VIGELMRHEGAVYSAQFSADGQRIVTASEDKTARLWDAATGSRLANPIEPQAKALVSFSRYGAP
jgi:WD40 repeat protein